MATRDRRSDAPGSATKRPRLEDVAAAIGMSPSSVSLALSERPGPSEETRRRVREAAERLGYRPDRTASLLARRRTRLLGVMLDIRSPFHAELVEDLHLAGEGRGYDLVLSTVTRNRDESRAIDALLDFRCEALILLGPNSSSTRLSTLAEQLPVVAIGMQSAAAGIEVVRAADDLGVAQAVAHLVELGHREIAFVDGGKGPVTALRRRGYRTAMRRHGLTGTQRIIPGARDERGGADAARRLLDSSSLPTAVIAFNDQCAVGLQDAFSRAGIDVPGQVSIVGYDNSMLAQLAHIDLTTVDQDAAQLAEHAVQVAADRLENGRTAPEEFVLMPRLVVRRTTGPVRSS